jgi:glycosyltransferase involved in cell wall biosynthesis
MARSRAAARPLFIDVTGVREHRGGAISGVTRVEREISVRLPALLGDAFEFVFFERQCADFVSLGTRDPLSDCHGGDLPRVHFPAGSRLVTFGLECNNKDYRHLIGLSASNVFELYSVLYDLTGALDPQLTLPGYGEFLRGFFADMFYGVSRYLAISEHSRRQLAQFAQQELLQAPPCDVFPLGCDLPALGSGSLPAALMGKRYALFVSTVEARKNHYALYRAFDRGLAEGRLDPEVHRLVFAGKIGWGVSDLVDLIRANPRTADAIVFLEGLDDAALGALYREANVCLMPSYDEGYGLPLAEALALGKVCLSSSAGALPEIGGDLVDYLDPLDVLGWRDAIATWLTAPPARIAAREARIRKTHRPVTWDDSAARFARLITAEAV